MPNLHLVKIFCKIMEIQFSNQTDLLRNTTSKSKLLLAGLQTLHIVNRNGNANFYTQYTVHI